VACAACHRFVNEGGSIGPDLTGVVGRYSVRDLLESIVDPNKVISDQYQAIMIQTTSGRIITGRIGADRQHIIQVIISAARAQNYDTCGGLYLRQ